VYQVQATVPAGVSPGDAVPVVLSVAGQSSQRLPPWCDKARKASTFCAVVASYSSMAHVVRLVRVLVPAMLGLLGIWLAVERWLWYLTLPRYASARLCGNCFLAAVGVPTELGLLGLLLVAGSFPETRLRGTGALYWCAAALGVFLTPVVLGVPLFAVTFVMLLWRMIKVTLRATIT